MRNLETAQDDERDVILLGANFGPTEPGGKTMSMAMGKLNASGGWRRLNAAATRARREMRVFTSFDPGMIDLTRTAEACTNDELTPAQMALADRADVKLLASEYQAEKRLARPCCCQSLAAGSLLA